VEFYASQFAFDPQSAFAQFFVFTLPLMAILVLVTGLITYIVITGKKTRARAGSQHRKSWQGGVCLEITLSSRDCRA